MHLTAARAALTASAKDGEGGFTSQKLKTRLSQHMPATVRKGTTLRSGLPIAAGNTRFRRPPPLDEEAGALNPPPKNNRFLAVMNKVPLLDPEPA